MALSRNPVGWVVGSPKQACLRTSRRTAHDTRIFIVLFYTDEPSTSAGKAVNFMRLVPRFARAMRSS